MLDLSLFQNRAFSVSLTSNVLNVFVSFGSFILVSQYLQLVLGLSPLAAGLVSLPASAAAIVGPMLSPMVAQRAGISRTVASLLAVAGVGFALQLGAGSANGLIAVAIGWALWALGGSAAATLTTNTLIGSARPERTGSVSALAQTGAELGGALGIAILGSVGTAIYGASVGSAIPLGLSPEAAAAAHNTLAGALTVASQLSDPAAAATLVGTAQQSLTFAVQITSAIAAALSIVAAVLVARFFDAPAKRPVEQLHHNATTLGPRKRREQTFLATWEPF
jgi:DHA2 family multidrug resistance protein-like MFS transporter